MKSFWNEFITRLKYTTQALQQVFEVVGGGGGGGRNQIGNCYNGLRSTRKICDFCRSEPLKHIFSPKFQMM